MKTEKEMVEFLTAYGNRLNYHRANWQGMGKEKILKAQLAVVEDMLEFIKPKGGDLENE